MKSCDLLLHSRFCLPVNFQDQFLTNHTIAIKNGAILEIDTTEKIRKTYQASEDLDLPNHLIMPGLINNSTAPPGSDYWGKDYQKEVQPTPPIYSATEKEARGINNVKLATERFIAKIIKSGTTTFANMSLSNSEILEVSKQFGIRCQIAIPVMNELNSDFNINKSLNRLLELHDELKHHPLITIAFGIQGPNSLSPQGAEKIAVLANEIQIPIQVIYESSFIIDEHKSGWSKQKSWLNQLEQLGALGPHLQLVQMDHLKENELELLQNSGSKIVHCASLALEKAQGYTPISKIQNQGISVGFGLKQTATNDSLNLFSEANIASLFAKHNERNSSAISSEELVQILTMGGADVLGIDALTGSIEAGKQADLIAINLENLIFTSKKELLVGLIRETPPSAIDYVFVSGRAILENKRLTHSNEN